MPGQTFWFFVHHWCTVRVIGSQISLWILSLTPHRKRVKTHIDIIIRTLRLCFNQQRIIYFVGLMFLFCHCLILLLKLFIKKDWYFFSFELISNTPSRTAISTSTNNCVVRAWTWEAENLSSKRHSHCHPLLATLFVLLSGVQCRESFLFDG